MISLEHMCFSILPILHWDKQQTITTQILLIIFTFYSFDSFSRYYYSYNYASTPRTLTLNLTCANPNHMVKLQGEVHYTIPSHSQDYCADLNQNCTVEKHCKCCTLKPNIQTCMKKMDISLNNYCVDVKGSCSLTVPRKEFTNEDGLWMRYQ